MSHNKHKEEWLNQIKDSLQDYREPVSLDSWDKLEHQLSTTKTSTPIYNKYKKIFWSASAVAAALLLFLIITPDNYVSPQREQISVVSNSPIEDNNEIKNIIDESYAKQQKPEKIITNTTISEIADTNINTITSEGDKATNNGGKTANEVTTVVNEVTTTTETVHKTEIQVENKVSEVTKQTTWEEYLKQEEKREAIKKRENTSNWLALSVGNSMIGSVNPRSTNIQREIKQVSLTDVNTDGGVKEIFSYKIPENAVLSATANNMEPKYNHKQPLSFGVRFGKDLSKKFTIETGLVYTYMGSEIENIKKDDIVKQSLHYLGIPIRVNWNFVNTHKFLVYAGAGGVIEKCIYGEANNEKLSIKSVQGAINGAVGAQYRFNKLIGIYFEPGISYHIGMDRDGSLGETKNGLKIKSINSQEPLGFTLQAGLRFSF